MKVGCWEAELVLLPPTGPACFLMCRGYVATSPAPAWESLQGAPCSREGKRYPWGFMILATVGVSHMPPVLLNICRISSLDPSNSLWVTNKGGEHRHMFVFGRIASLGEGGWDLTFQRGLFCPKAPLNNLCKSWQGEWGLPNTLERSKIFRLGLHPRGQAALVRREPRTGSLVTTVMKRWCEQLWTAVTHCDFLPVGLQVRIILT